MTASIFMAEVFRCFAALLLLCAAVGKLRTLADFRHNLTDTFGLRAPVAAALAPAVVGLEFALSLALAVNSGASAPAMGAMAAALLMFAVFTAVVARKYVQEGIVRCSCFGEAGRSVSAYDLLRNALAMACMAFYLVCAGDSSGFSPAAWFMAAGLAAFLSVVAVAFHDIALLLAHAQDGNI